MTWLDVGNGWRNIYLLSCVLQACALGTLFAAHRLFIKRSRVACFLTGVAATPLCQYLWTLLLSFVWPNAPKLVYIGVLPALSALCLLVMLLRRIRRISALIKRGLGFVKRVCTFDKPALVSLCFALCMLVLLAPACIRFCSSMNAIGGGDAGEYMALALRYTEDRDVANLLEKEETVGHFRGHSHFPSLELYMSYGLFHTGGETGYPFDKPAFTGLGLLTLYMVVAYLALLLALCRERKPWVLLGALLLNLVPSLYDSVAAAPRDIWRILALFFAMLVFAGLEPRGNWKAYIGKLLLSFAVCFTIMSTHVVCFVVLPFIVVAWVVWRWLTSLHDTYHGALRTLLSSAGIALAGAAGTVVAFLGNLWCYVKWGEMSPWRLMTTYTTAPWYNMYMDIEYKLDETTTHVNFWQAKNDVLMGYATPLGTWAWRIALIALSCIIVCTVVSRIRLRKQASALLQTLEPSSDGATAVQVHTASPYKAIYSAVCLCTLFTLFTLAPMTGLLDSPLYSFSGSFLKLQRYTLQWFMLAAIMLCAALSALSDVWQPLCKWAGAKASRVAERVKPLKPYLLRVPAYLCALLCALAFVRGTQQTGYATSFYRDSRGVMENEQILLDNGFLERYSLLMTVADHVADDQKILITRVGYQYPLRGRGYVLTSNPIVPLMNLPLQEVEAALADMNVAMLATEPDFWDERYYPLSTLSEYLNALPADQIVQTDTMRLYLLDRSLIPVATQWIDAAATGVL